MNPADLLDYALGRLEGPRRERLDRRMASDPALADRMARLIRNLGRLLDDDWADCSPGRLPAAPSRPASPALRSSAHPGDEGG
jgi:anti-sigma factor RsiW